MGRSREAETQDLSGASLRVFRGPQASSCGDANIVVSKASPGAFHQLSLAFLLNCYLYDMLECALSYRNCVGTVVAV
jgi:hypothetical protein